MKGKRIRTRDKDIDFNHFYELDEALTLIKERASAKFDETVEAIFMCQLDPRKSDQSIRGMIRLPHGTGKKLRIAVFAEGEYAQQASGADRVGSSDLIEEVASGKVDFNFCIATPAMMGQMSKIGKILGPKGLMPNPKLGTVTMHVGEAIENARKGQVSLRADKAGIVHSIIGKVSFAKEILRENFDFLYKDLLELKPSSIKKSFIKKVFVSSSMGFSLPIDFHSRAL